MTLDNWKNVTDIVSNVVVTLAALAGGTWAVFRFWKERTDEAALNLTVSVQSSPLAKNHLVAVTVELANKGKTKIQAKTGRSKSGLAFDDGVEKLNHSCSLQIKRFRSGEQARYCQVDWFEPGPIEAIEGLNFEINLLTEYEDPENNHIVDFWLEPAEAYRLERPVILPAGIYLGKVTFVAEGGDCNFWSRVFSFTVPASASAPETAKKNSDE